MPQPANITYTQTSIHLNSMHLQFTCKQSKHTEPNNNASECAN